jgi:hypothetical protein
MIDKIYIYKEPSGSLKKFRAVLPNGKSVRFGQRGYSDYTIHKDRRRMLRYLARHDRGLEDWSHRGIHKAGFWARWLLWSEPSMEAALRRATKMARFPVIMIK